jgi:molybdenum cofactor cytidylyltransferase
MAYWGIILAAGESKRMGTPKAFLTYRGKSFVERICANVRAAGVERTIIVFSDSLKENVQALRRRSALDLGNAAIVWNSRVERGQLYSLKMALARVPRGIAGVLVCLVDHPCVKRDTYKAIMRCARRNPQSVVIPIYRGKRGHPVVFPGLFFGALKKAPLKGGARMVVEKHSDSVVELKTADAGVLLDVDTPQAYGRLRS